MELFFAALGIAGTCVTGIVVGFVAVFAMVRSTGGRLQISQGRWSVVPTRNPGRPGTTMRSVN